MDKVREADKEKDVISAALIRAEFVIDSLMNDSVVIDTTNKTAEFIEVENPNIQYSFKAFGVLPYPPDTKPTLLIQSLRLPNEQFITFQWENERKLGYPVTFSVTNTNEYMKSGCTPYWLAESWSMV